MYQHWFGGVAVGGNILSQGDKDPLHSVVPVPLRNAGKPRQVDLVDVSAIGSLLLEAETWTHLSGLGIDAGEVDLGFKVNDRGLIGVPAAAVDLETVDAVLVCALCTGRQLAVLKLSEIPVTHVGGAEDSRVPVGHHHVVAIGETIRAAICRSRVSTWKPAPRERFETERDQTHQHQGPSRPSRAPQANGSSGEPLRTCLRVLEGGGVSRIGVAFGGVRRVKTAAAGGGGIQRCV